MAVDSTVTCAVVRPNQDDADYDDDVNNDAWLVPPYEFHVLDTANHATGRRPMVWLFQQMPPPVSRSVTQAGLLIKNHQQHNSNDNCDAVTIVLRYHSRARVTCPLRRSLLRFLPATQQQTEAWGSQALRKAVLAEVQACIQACRPILENAR